jgi:hypothetical protein
LNLRVVEQEFPSTKGIDAPNECAQGDARRRQCQATRSECRGHLSWVVHSFEPRHEDLDADTSPHDGHGERQVHQTRIARAIDVHFSSAAQEEVVRQHNEELHQTPQ